MSVVILYRIQFEYMYNLSKSGTCDNNILSLLYVLYYYINNLKGPMRLEPLSRNQFKDRNREFSQNILEYAIGRVK